MSIEQIIEYIESIVETGKKQKRGKISIIKGLEDYLQALRDNGVISRQLESTYNYFVDKMVRARKGIIPLSDVRSQFVLAFETVNVSGIYNQNNAINEQRNVEFSCGSSSSSDRCGSSSSSGCGSSRTREWESPRCGSSSSSGCGSSGSSPC